MEKKRSVGVMVFGILEVILGVALILLLVSEHCLFHYPPIEVIPYFIGGILSIFLGIGVLKLNKRVYIINVWFYRIIFVYCVYLTIGAIVTFKKSMGWSGAVLIVSVPLVIFSLILLFFFTRPKVKEQFR